MKRGLERIEIPGEHQARERSWAVVAGAFADRLPAARRRSWQPAAALALAAVALAGLLSPAGRAMLDEIREVVGVEKSAPALFSLPEPGRLLVVADSGAWVVEEDGSKRLLGRYSEASWSPFGAFVVAARRNELVALEPDGDIRWSLARPGVRFPRWGGTRTDTRIAYVSNGALRVVGGDGKGDRRGCARSVAAVAPAWRPGRGFVLAFAAPDGSIHVTETERCASIWRTQAGPPPSKLLWSRRGDRLLAVTPQGVRVYDDRGRIVARDDPSDATRDVDASFLASSQAVTVIRRHGRQSDVFRADTGRLVFRGTGDFTQVVPAPAGDRLLVVWPTADQWVFVHPAAKGRIEAVSNVSAQFRSRSSPRIEGWCCAG